MAHLKLTYFDFRGRGEALRLLLHYANVYFIDERIDIEKWGEIKSSTPFGTVPFLTIDGTTKLGQTYAMARFLARRYGLAGKDNLEQANLDAIADLYKDFFAESTPFLLTASGFQDGDKEKLYKETFVPAVHKYFPFLVKALKESPSGFFARSGVSWVDFFIANNVLTIEKLAPEVLTKYSRIVEHCKRVHQLPQLQKYLADRNETLI